MPQLHITNGNCKMPCSGILGSTKNQSAQAPLWVFVPPHFFVPVKHFVFSLSGTKKRQLPRTLCAIHPRFIEYILTKYLINDKLYLWKIYFICIIITIKQ